MDDVVYLFQTSAGIPNWND